ncbi:MAG TPA: YfiR family protein [Stellaceae bacterium]|nr:YfiR family protein [Stellaceae bacterium]
MPSRPGAGRLGRAARAAFTATLPGLLAVTVAFAETNPLELAIEATYLVKFGAFVEWPAGAFPTATSPFYLCVAGTHPFGSLLDRAAAGASVDRHPIAIRRLDAVPRDVGCHILFVGAGGQPPLDAALAAVRGKPVLTVTAVPPAEPRKGIVNFVMQNNHVRFAIDDRQAAADGLRISSQLLTLAVNLHSR